MDITLIEVLNKITKAGYEAYVVGGYPRDFYLGRKTTDYDVTTNATPEDLKKIFPDLDDKYSEYGKVIVKMGETLIEVTTYRIELNYQNHRKPTITYATELSIDLKRRDFIINTLCMDKHGNFIDLLEARKDIDKKLIRVVGNAKEKIEQDSLRILRAIRFATTLNFKLDTELKEAISLYKKNLKELSFHRKREELNRIFESDNVEYGIELLKEIEVELDLSGLSKVNTRTSVLGIWAQLDFSSNYKFSKNEKREIEKLKQLLKQDILDPYILYQYGYYYCGLIAEIKGKAKGEIIEAYKKIPIHHRDEIALTPKELMRLVPREEIGNVYEDLEQQIVSGNLENVKVFIKKYVMKKYNGRK